MRWFVPLLILFTGLMSWFWVYSKWEAKRRSSELVNWLSTEGMIRKSKHIEANERRMARSDISYDYVVDGVSYTSAVVELGDWASSKHEYIMFPVGRKVEVFYNPNKPSEAVLRRRLTKDGTEAAATILLVLISAIVILWGLALVAGSVFLLVFPQG